MRILVVSDIEERLLYDCFKKERVEGVDLIISCGDLKPGYLDFLITMVNKPMLYVMGNHDDVLIDNPPGGGISLEDKIVKFKGYKIAGLGGCLKYNHIHKNMCTEKQMRWRCRRLFAKSLLTGGIDLFVSHAPIRGYGDLEDFPHRGFECFDSLINRIHPMYMFHGHVHTNYHRALKTTHTHPCGTIIYNCCGYKIIDLPDRE